MIETKDRKQVESRIMILFGIIQQLMDTRLNRLFSQLDLSRSQFGLLVHFSHNPERRWTVTALADVMEMNQPGITKVAKKLIDNGLLETFSDDKDSRVKHLGITNKGLDYLESTSSSFRPHVAAMFKDWPEDELQQLMTLLEKHKTWLDENRIGGSI